MKPCLAASASLAALVLGGEPRITNIGAQTSDAGIGQYLEAESGVLSGGFVIGADPLASAGRFVTPAVGAPSEDAPGPARAVYALRARATGTYVIWGRIHDQDLEQNRFFFQLDDGDWIKWRITTGDVWFWDRLHEDVQYGTPYPFELTAGTHRLTIANCVDGAKLDRLFYAPDGSMPEGTETLCNPPHSVQFEGVCNPSCGSLSGHCGGTPCAGLPTVPTYDCPACCIPDQ
jgi:hypothetical protein